MCPTTMQCVHSVSTVCSVSKVRAVRSLDLWRICSANVNSKSAGHGAGVSFPVQIQPGDAGQGWTGSSPKLGSYLLSVGAAAALCNSIHSSTARRVQHCVHYKQQHHCAPCYAVPCASNVSLVNSRAVHGPSQSRRRHRLNTLNVPPTMFPQLLPLVSSWVKLAASGGHVTCSQLSV